MDESDMMFDLRRLLKPPRPKGPPTSYIYSWIRKDIPIVCQIIQHGHAMERAATLHKSCDPDRCPSTVLFEVSGENELFEKVKLLMQNNIEHHCFFEPDWPRGFTGLSTVPISDPATRELFANERKYVAIVDDLETAERREMAGVA